MISVERHIYIPQQRDGIAPWNTVFSGPDGYREEIQSSWAERFQKRGFGDTPMNPRRRLTRDNGKSWTALDPIAQSLTREDGYAIMQQKLTGGYDPVAKRFLGIDIMQFRDMRDGPPRRISNHALLSISQDGETYDPPLMLRYEQGPEYSDANSVLEPDFAITNTAYPGQSILFHSNGSVIIPLTNTSIPQEVGDDPGRRIKWPRAGRIGARCLIGRWNDRSYDWRSGDPVWVDRETSILGLLEADIAELSNGDVLAIWRVTKSAPDKPNYKYYALSQDGGLTFSEPKVFRYTEGRAFFSPSSFHRLFRSSMTGKLYWIGNISERHSDIAGRPRFPLCIAEVDETKIGLIKDSVTIIDTRQDGDGEDVQLSNFWIIENPDTQELHLYLTRLGENGGDPHNANCYEYLISFES